MNVGVYKLFDALKLSEELELDLVEISSKTVLYVKFWILKGVYEQRKEKKFKVKNFKSCSKGVVWASNRCHDYEFKKKHAEKFLKDGAKLKAFVFLKVNQSFLKNRDKFYY